MKPEESIKADEQNKKSDKLLESAKKLMERFQEPCTEEANPAVYASKQNQRNDTKQDAENFVSSRNQTDLFDIASGHEFTLSKKEEFFIENNRSPLSK